MKNGPAVYIGGGFVESQLLWLAPIVHGYCKARGIRRIVFDGPLPMSAKRTSEFEAILRDYEIDYRPKSSVDIFVRSIFFLIRDLFSEGSALVLAKSVSRETLLSKGSWFEVQLRHAVWDQSFLRVPDGTLDISFARKLVASVRIKIALRESQILVARNNVTAAFLGHRVYSWRALSAGLIRKNVEVYTHAASVIFRVPRDGDTFWGILTPGQWEKMSEMFSSRDSEIYWEGRILGETTYTDAKYAMAKTREVSSATPANVLMLHVFRDSPYSYLDQDRIFADYVDWVRASLNVLGESREEWLVKIHPSAGRWGENSRRWVEAIGDDCFGRGEWPANIMVSENEFSNIDLLENAKRVVTYAGTVHLEAACWGIRPITISEVMLGALEPAAVLKPAGRDDYRKLLLAGENSAIFNLSKEQIGIARQLLFVRENILGFGSNVGQKPLYRDDSRDYRRDSVRSVMDKAVPMYPLLESLGTAFAEGLPRSVNLEYLSKWRDYHSD